MAITKPGTSSSCSLGNGFRLNPVREKEGRNGELMFMVVDGGRFG